MSKSLTSLRIAGFSSPAFALAALGLPIIAILPPLYSELGISLTAVGVVFMIARFFDVFTDPVFGVLGDRVRTRWGRRRPAIVAGVPVLLLGVAGVFFPPDPPNTIYLLIALLTLYVGWTLLAIAHTAWASELSSDYNQRTRIMGALQFTGLLGAIAVLAIPAVVDAYYPEGGMRLRAFAMGVLILVAIPVMFTVALFSADEPAIRPQVPVPWQTAWRAITSNRGLRRLLLADLLMGLQGGINGAVHFFFVVQVLKLPESASLFLVLIFLTGLVFVPMFVWLSGQLGKHQTLCVAAIQSTFATGPFFVVPSESFGWVFLIFVLVGVNFGAKDMMMRSMMADVIDQDRVTTGNDRSALYYSMLTLTAKVGTALAVGIIYPVLDLVGFNPEGSNPQEVLDAVRIVVAASPTLITALVAFVMWRFPIGREEQRALRAQIEASNKNETELQETTS